ncbi:DUF2243 domain-containing protein [Corticibacterium sp. UT-5YL-CI-8]|nr:DUF2243 domain-containing protein [Tianweitania sp. UT-5YL-CI-8]
MAETGREPFHFSKTYTWAGYALGFSIGGFFDGILLHQILQWHHLLSGLEGGRFDDLRFQIVADGFFHLFMYVIGATGLWLLWRSRTEFGLPRADRFMAANALIGFGVWHVTDGIVSHWVLRLHWIKMDSDVPLLWDMAWFLVFGVAFIISGWMLRRNGPGSGTSSKVTPAAAAFLTFAMGAASLFPVGQTNGTTTIVVFTPGTSPAQAMATVTGVGGRLIWTDKHDAVWGIDLPENADRWSLYSGGAMLVSNTLLPAGCLDWFKAPGRGA